MKRPISLQKLIVLGLVLLAFFLRAYRLDFQSYWIDEAWTVYFAGLPLNELLHQLRTVEIHPPLYFPSVNRWVLGVGTGEYALRFYSLIFGVLAIPLVYRLGQALGGRRLGLLGALLMTVAPYQIWHSQEARMYTLLTAASAMSMWGFVKLWQGDGRRWWWVYLVGTIWTLLAHYHGLTVIGIQGLFLLLTWRRHRRGYLQWAGTLALIFLLYSPWLVASWRFLQSYQGWLPQAGLGETYLRSAAAYSLGELVAPSRVLPLVLLVLPFVGLYGIGLIYAARRRWGKWSGLEMLAFLLSYTLAPNLAAWLYGELRSPVYLERYLIPVQIGFLLTVAVGILAVGKGVRSKGGPWPARLATAFLVLALVGINGWVLHHHYTDPIYAKPDWRAVIRTIETFGQPGDAIILTGDGGEKVFDIYYQGDLPVYYSFNTPVPTPEEARQILAGIAAEHTRLWYTPYGAPIDATLESWLAGHTYPAWQRWLGRKRLALYAGQARTGRLEPLNVTFADASGRGPTLLEARLPQESLAAGDLLPLSLTWQTARPLPVDYQLSLRLVNQQGDIFAQSDWPPLAAAGGAASWPPHQTILDRRSLWLPPDLPPGQYTLQFVVYDPASGQALGQPVTLPGISVGPADTAIPPDALAIPNRTLQNLGDLTLLGYAGPEQIQPGQEMWLWLYWQARSIPEDQTVRLSLTSGDETVTTDFSLAASAGPLDSWQPGQVRRAVYHLPTSPRLAGPTAELRIALISPTGQLEGDAVLAPVDLVTRPRQFQPPAIAQPLAAEFGRPPLIKLIGYDVPVTGPAPGDPLPVTLYWQAVAEMKTNYTVFVHLLNQAGQVVSQADSPPQAGAAPTTTWLPGEILTDSYTLSLPADLPAGPYRLITGLYNPASGERLPVAPGVNFVELAQLTVK